MKNINTLTYNLILLSFQFIQIIILISYIDYNHKNNGPM